MNLLVGAQSGWGKSWKAQHVMEVNAPSYARLLVLDFKDEYRGLPKADLAAWWIAGPKERELSRSAWKALLDDNPKVVLARHNGIDVEEWRDLANRAVAAARSLGDVLVVLDEAHFLAPQRGSTPDAIKGLATTGRGEGASSIWITQRLSEAEETVISQCQARLLGGFESSADLAKIERIVEYPVEVHNPGVSEVPRLPDDLEPPDRDRPESLQRHVESGSTVGSEWIYSANTGARERRDTRETEMQSTHYGAEGKELEI